jgi:hypothetical protein
MLTILASAPQLEEFENKIKSPSYNNVFLKEFLLVAKVAIIHRKMQKTRRLSLGKFSQIWILTRNKIQILIIL